MPKDHGIGASVKRREDIRFLTGKGGFVDDVVPPGALHCHFLRANRAHARIVSMDLAAARALNGVHLVLASDDLLALGCQIWMTGADPALFRDLPAGAQCLCVTPGHVGSEG